MWRTYKEKIMSDNSLTLMGNLVANPEYQKTANGSDHLKGRIAVNESYNVGGEWKRRTNYFNFVCWDAIAVNAAVSAGKGDRVILHGRLQSREYVDNNGVINYIQEVIVKDLGLSTRWTPVHPVFANNSDSDTDDVSVPA